MTTQGVSTRMSVSEIVVASLAVALLVTGLATGVLAQQSPTSQSTTWQGAHLVAAPEQSRD